MGMNPLRLKCSDVIAADLWAPSLCCVWCHEQGPDMLFEVEHRGITSLVCCMLAEKIYNDKIDLASFTKKTVDSTEVP